MSSMLFENQCYEDGMDISERIASLVPQLDPPDVVNIAIRARNEQYLRHIPLFIAREMARHPGHNKELDRLLPIIIQRPDELADFLALYWGGKKQPLTNKVKKGLAAAFCKFNEYQFAKYNGQCNVIKLRDVMFMVHPKPRDNVQIRLFEKIANNKLKSADTWEVALSTQSEEPKAAFERLIRENKLGDMALLKNLRSMQEKDVDRDLIVEALRRAKYDKVLPFRFIAAARYNPGLESEIEKSLIRRTADMPRLAGRTCVLVDVSGSMSTMLSSKSDMRRIDAACGTAIISRELAADCEVLTFSDAVVQVPDRHGFSLRDSIVKSQPHLGTRLGSALKVIANERPKGYDRLIVITDEQSHDAVSYVTFARRAYCINVASAQNGVSYGGTWTHIDGFSENVFRYMQEHESSDGR